MTHEQLKSFYSQTVMEIGNFTVELDDRKELVKMLRVELAKRQAECELQSKNYGLQ